MQQGQEKKQEDSDFKHWEMVESYEQHGDENDGHVPYVPSGDRIMEAMRDPVKSLLMLQVDLKAEAEKTDGGVGTGNQNKNLKTLTKEMLYMRLGLYCY
ncbi:unnamed protein product [Arabidopsis arenosa]|uniref:Uncharacterized protein n=1 Tax=Arabidopsis arenosa TaxID=38785 RepID=A0A8S2B480_ARAAE|nr:unnamed protein product [Arabidopsis arenosa]